MPEAEPRPWIERLKRVPMLARVGLVVMALPVIEYALLLWISGKIGFTLTLLLVLGTGAVGTWFVRRQGLIAWERILDCVRQGLPVGEAIFDGTLILLAGVLLIMPGPLSDVAGFALLVTRSRDWIKRRLSQWLREKALTRVEAFRGGSTITLRGSSETDGATTGEQPGSPEKRSPSDGESEESESKAEPHDVTHPDAAPSEAIEIRRDGEAAAAEETEAAISR